MEYEMALASYLNLLSYRIHTFRMKSASIPDIKSYNLTTNLGHSNGAVIRALRCKPPASNLTRTCVCGICFLGESALSHIPRCDQY